MITPLIRRQGFKYFRKMNSIHSSPASGEDSGGRVQSTPDNILDSFNLRQNFMVQNLSTV
jgi:hypothetical protein